MELNTDRVTLQFAECMHVHGVGHVDLCKESHIRTETDLIIHADTRLHVTSSTVAPALEIRS